MGFSNSEKRSLLFLSLLYVLRLSGNFLILPLFEPYSRSLLASDNVIWIGLALGIFGFGQSVMQLPLGWLSDRVGRKNVIIGCLSVFTVATYGCFEAHSITQLTVARFFQGLCAYSSVLTALMADYTRPENLTKASAILGVLIGITLVLCLSISPVIAHYAGTRNIFLLIMALALISMLVTTMFLPSEPPRDKLATQVNFRASIVKFGSIKGTWLIATANLATNAVLSACWLVFPSVLANLGYDLPRQGSVYGSVMIISFVIMSIIVALSEKKHNNLALIIGFILMSIGQGCLFFTVHSKLLFMASMAIFFSGFNLLEASIPATVARIAPKEIRGTSMGISSTAQFVGIFMGSLLSGIMLHYVNNKGAIFIVNAILSLVFFWAVWLKLPTCNKQNHRG
ncbi:MULTISPECIES: MFS transporter [Candidatus Ichthyocystis]|uniref:MFS transporter n=1 Tax=Candidatus Ichthyocystis TaxID=2929841 RepID=UPI000B80E023|nr:MULTISPECIES: MFS transporter [Ichthyocystis]